MEKFVATPELISELKKKHGRIYLIESVLPIEDDPDQVELTAIVRRPTRNELSYAASVSKSDPMKFNAAILQKCWLGGDQEIQTNDVRFMGVASELDQIISAADTRIKKL